MELTQEALSSKAGRRYNVAFLWHGARNIGGGERCHFYLINGLRRDIFNPIVIYTKENMLIEMYREAGIETIKIPLSPKITSVYRDQLSYNPLRLCPFLWYLMVGTIRVIRILRSHNIDLLHPHDNVSKIIGGIAARCVGVKVVAHCQDELKNGLTERLLLLYQLFVMDRVIAAAGRIRELFSLGKKPLEKVITIHNGIDLTIFDPDKAYDSVRKEIGIRDGSVVIGIIAIIDKLKGHIYLFEALKKLKSTGFKDFMCLVIGDGREKEELTDFVEKNGLSMEVMFLGYRQDIPRLMKALDILVIPSVQETFPLVALEAMAMRLPVIATSIGGLPEAVLNRETGIIVPPGDAEALYGALKYLIENPGLRVEMGRNGRKRVEENFTVRENIRKTEQMYLQVLGHQGDLE